MGGNRDYFSGMGKLDLRFPKAGNGNGNEVMGMGGNGVNGQKGRWTKKPRAGRPAFLTPLGHEGVIAYI